eukprot:9498731-Pyramimonas_sp.AAC.1
MYDFEFFFDFVGKSSGHGGLRFGNKDTAFNSRYPPGGGYYIDFYQRFDGTQHTIRSPGTGDIVFNIQNSNTTTFEGEWPTYYRITVVSENKAFARNDLKLEAFSDSGRLQP